MGEQTIDDMARTARRIFERCGYRWFGNHLPSVEEFSKSIQEKVDQLEGDKSIRCVSGGRVTVQRSCGIRVSISIGTIYSEDDEEEECLDGYCQSAVQLERERCVAMVRELAARWNDATGSKDLQRLADAMLGDAN